MKNDENKVARGVYAAVLTPFSDRLEPDTLKFVEHCRWLLENGCDGLAPFGTTGEGASLSAGQKIELLKAAKDAGLPMDRMIVGAGSCALEDAVAVGRAATLYGCEGVLFLPPFYFKNPSDDGLFNYFSELIGRVADERFRIYLYHFPKMSAVPISAHLIERLLAAFPSTVVGLKDSSGDWSNTEMMLNKFPGFGVFSGSEEFLLDNLNAGGAGCISATTNVTAPLAQKVFQAWKASSGEIESLQNPLSETRLMLQALPMVPMLKALKALAVRDDNWLHISPPLDRLTYDMRQALDRMIPRLETLVAAASGLYGRVKKTDS